jgi:hypothetical protein
MNFLFWGLSPDFGSVESLPRAQSKKTFLKVKATENSPPSIQHL